ncbi:hypothetical protein BDY24DRAFT_443674 [Mrakia frigida]|uniref:nicotinamide-nucleotide adenylyltransferase n=1 Tax=Mrakia frigida TaxID=29902 RepID=UPI003FCC1639
MSLSLPHLRSSLSSVLDPLSPQPFQLIWSSHPRWPLPPAPRLSSSSSQPPRKGPFTISILDSSWNPPTNAHLSLVTAPLPPGGDKEVGEGEYDAHLLLLSVKNVDKVLKSGDASFEQRLQMIHLLALSLLSSSSSSSSSPSSSSPRSHSNLAIGILSEPAFIAKDVVVRNFLQQHARTLAQNENENEQDDDDEEERRELERGQVRLAWLVGTDTLWRFFDRKYYPSSTSLLSTLSPFFTRQPPSSTHPGSLLIHFPRLPSPPVPPPPSFDVSVLEALPPGSVRVGRSRDAGRDWGRVSSTVVRNRCKEEEGKGLEMQEEEDGMELVPEGVRRFLEREGLYR